ncbi:MAG: sulfotransferase [Bacteroidota bacterium]
MGSLKKKIARQADRKLAQVQGKLRRILEGEAIAYKKANKLTLGKVYGEEGWDNMQCVFMLSTGRTGTQTMANVLKLSAKVLAEHEPRPRLVKSSFDAYMDVGSEDWMTRWTDFVLAVRDDFVLEANAKGQVYVESNNRLTYVAPAVAAAFPASKFIFSHRDPYQVIQSGMRRGAYAGPNMAWNFARIRPRAGEPFADSWETMAPLAKEAWRWARINQISIDFIETLPAGRGMELPARRLFGGSTEMIREIFDFIGVPCPDMADIQRVMGKKMNAQAHFNGLSFEWTAADYKLVRPYIASVAEALGYELK